MIFITIPEGTFEPWGLSAISFFLWSSPIFFSLLAVSATNPLNSVIALILVFLFSALYLISIANPFIALVYLIIYVGAIAVLFLFVVMMMNLKLIELNRSKFSYYLESPINTSSHIPLAGIILSIYFFWALGLNKVFGSSGAESSLGLFLIESHSSGGSWDFLGFFNNEAVQQLNAPLYSKETFELFKSSNLFFSSSFTFWDLFIYSTHSIFSIAYIFYSNYIFFLIGLSLLLLLAIIGPIILFLDTEDPQDPRDPSDKKNI